jgi:autoinducer 2-degrading protein
MITTIVHVKVKQEHIEAFIRATVKNHAESVKENGNLRFDVLQKADDPSEFALYKAYESEEHAAAHKHTPHYLEWRETVAEWMAQPREGIKYQGIKP